MKRLLTAMAMLSMALAQGSNLRGSMANLVETSKSFLIITSAIFLIAGMVSTAIGALIYLKKLKNAEKRETIYLALAALSGFGGVLVLLAGLLGLVIALLMPSLIQSMVGGPL